MLLHQIHYLKQVDYDSIAVGYNRRPSSKVCVEEDQDRVTILSVATAGSIVTRPEGVCKIITTTV